MINKNIAKNFVQFDNCTKRYGNIELYTLPFFSQIMTKFFK